jgi:hypothetical protein
MVREKRPACGAEHCTRRERLSAHGGRLTIGTGSQSDVGSVGSQCSVGFRKSQSIAGRGSEVYELDFFGVDGALEKTSADADEALDGIGGEEADRAGACGA